MQPVITYVLYVTSNRYLNSNATATWKVMSAVTHPKQTVASRSTIHTDLLHNAGPGSWNLYDDSCCLRGAALPQNSLAMYVKLLCELLCMQRGSASNTINFFDACSVFVDR